MFGLVVKFRLTSSRSATFDRLARDVLAAVREREPGTLVYAVHEVEGEPDARVFYEVYRDREAFEEHEAQEHTRRFLEAREACFAAPPVVDFLTVTVDKGLPALVDWVVENSAPLGERIAYHRRRRGLSQVKLAGLVARSESWLSQVERGVRSIDRLSVLAQLASALNIPVTELAPDTLPDTGDQEEPAVRALRSTLVDYQVIDTLLDQAGAPAVASVDADELRRQVDEAWEHVHASRFTPLADVAPALIAQAERHARAVPENGRRAALELVAEAYLISASVLAKLRETDMAWVAGDRAVLAAVRAQEPLLAAASAFRIGHAFLSGGRPEDAQRVAQSAAAALATGLDGASVEHIALWGALNLVVAIAATRRADSAAAIGAMRSAEQAAQRVGQDRNDFHTEFGPTNVALHAVAVSVELGDAGEALRRAATIDASQLSDERRARFLIDVARAYGQRRKAGDAVRALLEAEALTPEQVRTHGLVRELVRDLLRGQRRQVDSQLRGLARRIGVLPQ